MIIAIDALPVCTAPLEDEPLALSDVDELLPLPFAPEGVVSPVAEGASVAAVVSSGATVVSSGATVVSSGAAVVSSVTTGSVVGSSVQ